MQVLEREREADEEEEEEEEEKKRTAQLVWVCTSRMYHFQLLFVPGRDILSLRAGAVRRASDTER